MPATEPRPPQRPGDALPDAARRLDAERVRAILPQLIDSLSDAVVVVDRSRRVVAANRRYLETFGVRDHDLVGYLCEDVLDCPEVAAGVQPGSCAACQAAMNTRQPHRHMRNLPDGNGGVRRWEASFNPVVDEKGEVTHVVEVWRDISERSRLESQLSHSERLASLGILAAGVAHEINNPMASVLAGVESLERWLERREFDDAGLAEAREILQVLEREGRRCRDTTDKLMLLAQPYAVAASWTDVNRAVRDTLSLLRHEMRKHSIRAVEDLSANLPDIWARESGIRGVCMNLMMNAVQAMPNGGTLTVRTRRVGDRVSVSVEDTGPGIAPELRERIWDPFFTTKPVGQGTGLGLSITQRIVTRHGGTIRLEGEPGQGARFVIELPIAEPGVSGV